MPRLYQSGLDSSGRRRDALDRVEFSCGSVEYLLPPKSLPRSSSTDSFPDGHLSPLSLNRHVIEPLTVSFVFVVDVSHHAIHNGTVQAALTAISAAIDDITAETDFARIGIVTYDSTIHFYDIQVADVGVANTG